ncbi:MAG TPA: VOC family protein [Candidatus Acidoferrum sp.]|nr:VOC family protein [Candidatus Acidoferrum sp.]
MPRVVHFEINADKPERASKFYGDLFGWKINKWEGGDYWLVSTGDKSQAGIDGGIMKRDGQHASTYNTVAVESLDEYLTKVTKLGGTIHRPKTQIPGIGWFAYCKDTEGNVFGIIQPDMPMK